MGSRLTGFLRQFAHEYSLCPPVAFAERMHSIEVNHHGGRIGIVKKQRYRFNPAIHYSRARRAEARRRGRSPDPTCAPGRSRLDWKREQRMLEWQPRPYKDYQWIVADPELLGGKLAIRGTRLSVELILECLSNGMSLGDIDESFHNAFPHAALHEVLKVASEFAGSFHVAA